MNPAIPLLLRLHARSRLRRIRESFATPRKALLMLAAIVLGMIWLGQTIASVMFRDPYDPQSLRYWTSLILTTYFGWHFIRVAYKRPDHAIEWSPAEEAQIVGGPFRRRDILVYRLLVILTSTLPKALLAAFVLLPDLWWSGLPGIVLALLFLESFRMAIDIAVCCLDKWSYRIARSLVFLTLLICAAAVVVQAGGVGSTRETTGTHWIGRGIAAADSLYSNPVSQIVQRPFAVFADVITAQSPTGSLVWNSTLAILMVGGLLLMIGGLDRLHEWLVVRRHQTLRTISEQADESPGTGPAALPRIPQFASIGPIAWRQMKSAARYPGSLLVAVAIPALLSCLTLVSVPDPHYAFLALVGTVLFYSFVLLPEAIKFDFRLDSDHLVQLKVLPVPPLRLVIGQLTVPILVATLFQIGLYLLAGVLRPVHPTMIIAALLLSVPVNILFVATDNLIYLLYPHRPAQEGFEAFVRTILKFTFKSVLLGVATTVVVVWALSSRFLVEAIGGVTHHVQWTFVVGLCLAAWAAAAMALSAVTAAFERFDVSVSVPT